jgi:hypothetical protein
VLIFSNPPYSPFRKGGNRRVIEKQYLRGCYKWDLKCDRKIGIWKDAGKEAFYRFWSFLRILSAGLIIL